VDHYIVASTQAEKKLLKKKFPEDKLHVFPYPVRRSFLHIKRSRDEILGSLDLQNGRKTMLVTLGSEGIGSIYKMIEALVKRAFPLNVIAVAGKNDKLRQQLQQDFGSRSQDTRVVALGYQDRLNELIHAADFCFIKPGPATTWEVLSMKKPIIFFESAQLSENPNIKFVVNNGLGYFVGNMPRKLSQIVDWCIGGYGLEECGRAYKKINVENGSEAIARFVDRVVETT
jgi:processive 1,2-diacylglycerol beta-glucosyltransferase